mgnify:CR=1 FL=1
MRPRKRRNGNMLKGKHVVLAVTGGIAAYKMATMASLLVKQHADVRC